MKSTFSMQERTESLKAKTTRLMVHWKKWPSAAMFYSQSPAQGMRKCLPSSVFSSGDTKVTCWPLKNQWRSEVSMWPKSNYYLSSKFAILNSYELLSSLLPIVNLIIILSSSLFYDFTCPKKGKYHICSPSNLLLFISLYRLILKS